MVCLGFPVGRRPLQWVLFERPEEHALGHLHTRRIVIFMLILHLKRFRHQVVDCFGVSVWRRLNCPDSKRVPAKASDKPLQMRTLASQRTSRGIKEAALRTS